MSLHHINIVVSNLEKSKEFFSHFRYTQSRGKRISGAWLNAVTGLSNVEADYIALQHPQSPVTLELLKFDHPESTKDGLMSSPAHIGYRHIALTVDDIDSTYQRLMELGIEFLSTIQSNSYGRRMCYCKGPDGILVEIIEID